MTINEFSNTFEKQPANITKELNNFLKKVNEEKDYIVEEQLTDKGIELLALNQKGTIALKYRVWYYDTDRTVNIWDSLKKPNVISVEGRDVIRETVTQLEFPDIKATSLAVTKRIQSYVNLISTLNVPIEEADNKVKERVQELVNVGIKGANTYNIVKEMLIETYPLTKPLD